MKHFGTINFTPLLDKGVEVTFEPCEGLLEIDLQEIQDTLEATKAVSMVLQALTSSQHHSQGCPPDKGFNTVVGAEVVPGLEKALVVLTRYSKLLAENRY